MALAVSLLLDAATAGAVEALWARLAEAGISTSMVDLGYPPHLTLTVIEDESLAAVLQRQLAQRAWGYALDLTIGPVDRFDGTDIVWLAGAGDSLRALQEEVCGLVLLEQIDPHYRPDSWVPHVTLQSSGAGGAARLLAEGDWKAGVKAKAVAVELARFRPVVPLWRAEFLAV